MADTLGEAYLQIVVQGIDQAISEVKRLESATENSAKKSESTINNLSNLKRQILNQEIKAEQDAIQQRIQSQDKAAAAIMKSHTESVERQLKVSKDYAESDVKAQYQHLQNKMNVSKSYAEADVQAQYQASQKKLQYSQDYSQGYIENEKRLQSQLSSLEQAGMTKKEKALSSLRSNYEAQISSNNNLLSNGKISTEQSIKNLERLDARYKENTKSINQMTNDGTVGFATASINILKAAPAFAVATAAIGAVYGALRGLRDEFIAGLSAVEDYSVKVASMSAFLTTFNKNLTKENVSQVYKDSNIEAQKLVQTMEKLDARTIGTGKDLLTMTEQFIKGGVQIDTANKGTIDGFVNIANALKLLTQGQNQEIQMRQEIRALVQGQLKDTNILAKTLESIDPNIKEHIKLWKDEGTLIENIGELLGGFGPAAKDLENTWAVVGTTMETIHTRILRGAFKPTYDSLVETAKNWNKLLIDAQGNLTPFALSLQSILKIVIDLAAAFTKAFLWTSASFGLAGIITGIVIAIEAAAAATWTWAAAQAALTLAINSSPLVIFTAIGVAVSGIIFAVDRWVEGQDKVKESLNDIGTAADVNLARYNSAVAKSAEIMGRLEKKPEGNAPINIVPYIPGTISSSTVSEAMKPMDAYLKELERKSTIEKNSARGTLEAKIANGEFAATFKMLKDGGALAADALDEWTAKARKYADTIDQNKSNEKFKTEQDAALKSLQSFTDSLRIKDAALEKTKVAVVEATQATRKYQEQLAKTGAAGQAEAAEQRRLAILYDQDKIYKDNIKTIDSYYEKLQNKMDALNAAPGETEQLILWENKFTEAMFEAGSSVNITAKELDGLYEKLSKFDDMINKVKSSIADKDIQKLTEGVAKWKMTNLPGSKEETKEEKAVIDLQKWKDSWDKMTDIQKEKTGISEQMWEDYYVTITTMNDNWVMGAKDGLDKYAHSTTNAFKTASDAVQRAFKGMEDALVDFVKTGKFNFSNMVDSMLSDLIRFQIQQSITQPLAKAASNSDIIGSIGSMFSGLFSASANGNAFNQSGRLQAFANGGAFTNSIVTQPTIFPFANGTGLMGEAGPEAIMPLERNSQGKLGVVASGSNTPETIKVEINIENKSSQPVTASSGGSKFDGKSYIVTTILEDVQGNGPLRSLFAGGVMNG